MNALDFLCLGKSQRTSIHFFRTTIANPDSTERWDSRGRRSVWRSRAHKITMIYARNGIEPATVQNPIQQTASAIHGVFFLLPFSSSIASGNITQYYIICTFQPRVFQWHWWWFLRCDVTKRDGKFFFIWDLIRFLLAITMNWHFTAVIFIVRSKLCFFLFVGVVVCEGTNKRKYWPGNKLKCKIQ